MDNGLEFKNKTMRELVNDWPGECKIVHSRPRHPQTNGLVEQSNGTVKTMLSAMMIQIGLDKEASKDWPTLLPRVMFNLNTQRHSATKYSPYHLAFKQLPNLGNQVTEVETADDLEASHTTDDQSTASKPSSSTMTATTATSSSSSASSNKSSIRRPPSRSAALTSNLSTSKDDTDDDASASIIDAQPPSIICHLCQSGMSTEASKYWRACEKCANWCCDFCLKNVVSDDEFLCNSCINNKLKDNRIAVQKKKEESESLSLRKKASLNQEKARRQMCLKYNNKKGKTCFEFKIGDKVSVKVDKLDRISLDLKRIPGIVSSKSGDKDLFYSITTEFGVLDTKYRAYELDKYHGLLNVDISKITKKITLREVCRKFNNREVKVDKASIFCKCSGKCFNDKRCNCFKNKKICTSHCLNHVSGKNCVCTNKDEKNY